MTDSGANNARAEAPAFVELPHGLFTAEGVWFHTTVADLEDFAGPVLERISLRDLLAQATVWLRSPDTLALWTVLTALLLRDGAVAAVAGLVAFSGWAMLSPGLVFRPLIRVLGFLRHPLVVGGAYVAGLSWLGTGGDTWSVAFGLVWFVLVRWAVLERVLSPLIKPVLKKLYGLPPADQILRGVIVRHALAQRVSVGDLEAMEKRMLEIANRHRK